MEKDYFNDSDLVLENCDYSNGKYGVVGSIVGSALLMGADFAEYLLDFAGNRLTSTDEIKPKPSLLDGILHGALCVARTSYLRFKYVSSICGGIDVNAVDDFNMGE